jgi:hypothetical protein
LYRTRDEFEAEDALWYGSDVTGLSAQVHNCQMPFALLQVAESQLGEFMPTELPLAIPVPA